nr:hypothetical protein [Tanacetum cinerariifolium]
MSSLRYIALPNWFHEAHMETRNSDAPDGCYADVSKIESKIPTVNSPVPVSCLDISPESSSGPRLITKGDFSQKETPSLGNALTLSNRFEDTFRVEANLSNIETSIPVSPTPTFRIHKDHLKSQIIGPVDTHVQTRHKSKEMEEQRVRPIGIKWVLKNKKDERGIIIRNKVRLVAQEYTQEEGIDYEEVFAPVARIEAIRLFLAYASFMGIIVYRIDVKSAFLYGTIDEEVYVMQPSRFQDPEFLDRVYKVEKAMYGIHQAPRAWYDTLSKEFEALMNDKFQMSAIDELTFFLGLQVIQKKDGIFLSQDKYVGDILKKFRYSDVRSMIGSLMYLTASRQDIMFAVCACARHQVTPKKCHLNVVKRNFRYLKDIPSWDYGILKNLPLTWWHIQIVIMVVLHKIESQLLEVVSFWEKDSEQRTHEFMHVYLGFASVYAWIGIETTNQETKILTAVDGKPRTISESSLRRHLKLNDEERISSLPDAELFENLSLMGYNILPNQRRYTRRAIRIAQSKALSPVADEPAYLLRDDRQGEAFPTISSLDAEQDRENIAKTSALPHESSPRVTSLDADEGTASVSLGDVLPTVGVPTVGVPTVSGSFPTISATFTTASVVTPYTRRPRGITIGSSQPMRSPIIGAKDKGKEKVVESEVPKKRKLQERIDAQVAREMEEEFARENQRLSEQLTRDSEIARLHAEEELEMMMEGLDRSNEVIAKHLREYEQAVAKLSVGEKLELISELVKYQDHRAKILKYQAQQSKPLLKKEQREFYMSLDDFVPMSSKEESERVKRQGLRIDQGSAKRVKTSKSVYEGVSKEELKGMMQLVLLEEVYIKALQQFDREDLCQLWTLVKETFSIKQATKDKEKELWVELKRLFKPDFEDQLWTHNQAFMHDPLDWKLYDTCGVHHVSTKDKDIFMLVEKDYPLRKGLATVMISNKLQVEEYSQMANDLILKIHNITNSPR